MLVHHWLSSKNILNVLLVAPRWEGIPSQDCQCEVTRSITTPEWNVSPLHDEFARNVTTGFPLNGC